jgi:hypothetical protein
MLALSSFSSGILPTAVAFRFTGSFFSFVVFSGLAPANSADFFL